jgi:hypothetical protein
MKTDELQLIADCLKQKAADRSNLEAYLRSRKVAEQMIPGIIAQTLKVEQARRTAKSRMQEGGVIATLGLGGVTYATIAEKNGTVWLIWSVVGLGILANGWWKKKKIKQYC